MVNPYLFHHLVVKAGDFAAIYRKAFERIVLKGEDISSVLAELEPALKQYSQSWVFQNLKHLGVDVASKN